MDKLYAIKIRQSDGTYGAAIPVSVLAENVDWNSTLSLVDILGLVDTSESIQDQINNLKNTRATQASVNALDQKVDNAVEYITHNSEIADAREGADGTEYSTLKERLDSEYNDLLSKNASSLVMVNEDPEDTTKVNITTSDDVVELALQSDVDRILVNTTHPFKHLLCIGDSYSQGLPGANGQGWIYWLQYYWNLTQGTDIFYSSVRAGGFTDDGTVIQSGTYHRGFIGQLNDLASDMTADERGDISDILVCGGWNDNGANLNTVLLPHANTFNTIAKTYFPNARITLAYIAGTNVPSYFGNVQNGIFKYKTIAAQLKWRYIINSEYVSRYAPLYGADDLSFHPNDYSQITRYIMEGFLSGSCNVRYGSSVTITPKSGYTLQYTNFATQIKANELAWEFPADYIRIVLSTPYSGYITDGITFGDLVGNIVTPPYTRRINGSCGLKDNGKWYSAPGQLIINSSGEIGVRAAIASGGGNWQSMTSLSEIRFYSGTSNVVEGLNA